MAWVVLCLLSCAAAWYGEPCCRALVGRKISKGRKRGFGHLVRGV
jgi:hypothetical protein